MKSISVAVPFFNRSSFIGETVKNIIDDPRVSEIVFQDDFSSEDEYDLLTRFSSQVSKIKVYRNPKNLGAYFNKLEAVRNCSNEWVVLLDSDNFLYKSYLDSVFNEGDWLKDFCYIPDEMLANGNREPWGRCEGCWDHGRFGRIPIGFNDISSILKRDHGIEGLLNAGNFFINRDYYLQVSEKIFSEKDEILKDPFASDCLALMYYWLKDGGKIKILLGAEYFHRMHDGSLWKKLSWQSGEYSKVVMEKFKNEKI